MPIKFSGFDSDTNCVAVLFYQHLRMDNAVLNDTFLQQCSDKLDELGEKVDGQLFAFDVSLDEWLESSIPSNSYDCMPISLGFEPHDDDFDTNNSNISRLLQTDNELLQKILVALASVAVELKALSHDGRAEFLSAIEFYGEEQNNEKDTDAVLSTRDLSISRMLPKFIQLSAYRQRCCIVMQIAVNQLIGLCALDGGGATNNNHATTPAAVLPQSLINAVCDLLYTLVTVDHALTHNAALRRDWTNFQRLMHGIQIRPGADNEFNIPLSRVSLLENLLKKLYLELFDTGLFYAVVNQPLCSTERVPAEIRPGIPVSVQRWRQELNLKLANLDNLLKSRTNSRTDMLAEHRKLLDVILMLIVLHHMQTSLSNDSENSDAFSRRFSQKLAELLLRRLPVCCLGTGVWIDALDFLASRCPSLFDAADLKRISAVTSEAKISLWSERQKSLPRDVAYIRLLSYKWLAKLRDTIRMPPERKLPNELIELLLRGITFGRQASVQMLALYFSLPQIQNSTLPKSLVPHLIQLCELIFHIHNTYRAYRVQISIWCHDLIDNLLARLQNVMLNAIQRVKAEIVQSQQLAVEQSGQNKSKKRLAELQQRLMENLSYVHLINQLLASGPMTKTRLACIKTVFDLAFMLRKNDLLTYEEMHTTRQLLRNIALLSTLPERVHTSTTLIFNSLYWSRKQFLPLFVDFVQEDLTNRAEKLKIFAAIFRAISEQHAPLLLESSRDVWLQSLEDELHECLTERLLDPICQQIETALRLHVHAQTLKLPARDPFSQDAIDFRALLALRPIRIGRNRKLSCTAYVEDYLSRTFYDLTAVAPHDWHTYVEMSCAVQQLYGLQLIPSGLPSQTLEQGVDVLQIMRRIHVFVQSYNYSLNDQVFIESDSSTAASSKHLNTIGIRHVANSIRTHGMGVVNTTVNYTYQFLKKQLHQFSTFLYNEHIRAQLSKELAYVRKRNDDQNAHPAVRYPYERAVKFNRGIRKLGTLPGGGESSVSQLDKFRQLITAIGNALGFVRTVRTGGMNAAYQSARFVPTEPPNYANEKPSRGVEFAKLAANEGFSGTTQRVAAELDAVLRQTVQSFSPTEQNNVAAGASSDYLRMLVDTIAPDIRIAMSDENGKHLHNFFIIVPALTVNFVEHITTCKDKLNKRGASSSTTNAHQAATFCEDGFAMGIAYLLALLGQFSKFDDLQWLDEVQNTLVGERAAIAKIATSTNKSSAADLKAQQQQSTSILAAKRLDVLQKEFELLSYMLLSARIFFTGQSCAAGKATLPKDVGNGTNSTLNQQRDDDSDAMSIMSFSSQKPNVLETTPAAAGRRSGMSSATPSISSASLYREAENDAGSSA